MQHSEPAGSVVEVDLVVETEQESVAGVQDLTAEAVAVAGAEGAVAVVAGAVAEA